jgi:tartrate-resistant acid phosphatase type 5
VRPSIQPSTTVFAVIGDFGTGNDDARAIAQQVASWEPEFIVTVGDNYYSTAGGSGTERYAKTVGQLYGKWADAFYPSLGNHDYRVRPAPGAYTDYFTLPGGGLESSSGNERYYDFVRGPVHFFVLNSNEQEPDGTSATSKQARWLRRGLSRSAAEYNVVICHHPPYSSGNDHAPSADMRWPFAAWGVDVVLSGHDHFYERVMRDGIVYFVNGAGGVARYDFGKAVRGSVRRYSDDFGAQKVSVTDSSMVFEFYSAGGGLVDRYEVTPRAHHSR